MTYSALLGAAGSAVSQDVLIAGGVQDSFSWKSVAMAGVSAGVGSGLPAAASLPSTIARGVASNAITQGVAVNRPIVMFFVLLALRRRRKA